MNFLLLYNKMETDKFNRCDYCDNPIQDYNNYIMLKKCHHKFHFDCFEGGGDSSHYCQSCGSQRCKVCDKHIEIQDIVII
jgi:hypothetical protein